MKPNILFFLLDSVRADKFYGDNKTSITPNLDALIKKGTYFTQTISSTDATILSLSSFFNSSYPFRINNNRTWKIIMKENNNLEILKKNGYHIFGTIPGIASMAEMSQYCENEDNEYDAFDKTDRSATTFPDGTTGQRKYLFEDFNNSVGEKITDFLESNTMKEPWFYYIHSHDLHPHKITVPKEFDDEKFGKNKYEKVISSMDVWIRNIINKIDLSKTLVVITSDHGIHYPINEQGYSYFEPKFETELNIGKKIMPHSTHKVGAKMIVSLRNKVRDLRLEKANKGLSPYEIRSRRPHVTLSIFDESIRIPLLFVGYNTPDHKIISQQVSGVDIFPTIFEIVGIDYAQKMDGRSLITLFKDMEFEEKPIYLHTNPHVKITSDDKVGIRTPEFKYFRLLDGIQDKNVEDVYLYDLKNDPFENNNLAKSNPNKVKEMENILQTMSKSPEPSTNESELTKVEEEKIESQLKKLGYIGETDSISNNTQ
jgi:arylsulfatase A-like enzyme